MSELVFVDTNVFIYALDQADVKKQEAARLWRTALWKNRRGRTSFQVLQEFYVKVSQKWPDTRSAVRSEIRDLLAWEPVAIDEEVLEQGWKVQDRFQLSFWDALIVAAAKAASCKYLLTEDLQANQDMDGLLVVNPFLRSSASVLSL